MHGLVRVSLPTVERTNLPRKNTKNLALHQFQGNLALQLRTLKRLPCQLAFALQSPSHVLEELLAIQGPATNILLPKTLAARRCTLALSPRFRRRLLAQALRPVSGRLPPPRSNRWERTQ